MKRSLTYHFLLFGPLFPLLLFSFSFAQPSSLAPNTTEQYLKCNAIRMLTCGEVHTEIKYPFWTNGLPDYCGHPGYNLTCDEENKTLWMNISGKPYHVRRSIDYENKVLDLIDADLSAVTTANPCPEKITNTTSLPYSSFLANEDINLTLYLNCSFSTSPSPDKLFPILCTSSSSPHFIGQNSFFTLAKEPIQLPENEHCNSTVLVPVYDDNFSPDDFIPATKNFSDALMAGFGVTWTVGQSWCGDCTESGGLCGYNVTHTDDGACFCPVGTTNEGTHCSHGKRQKLDHGADSVRRSIQFSGPTPFEETSVPVIQPPVQDLDE